MGVMPGEDFDQPDRLSWDDDLPELEPGEQQMIEEAQSLRVSDKLAPKKKHRKKSRALREMAFETTQAAQTVMREEMERGVHKEPVLLSDVITDVLKKVPSVPPGRYRLVPENGTPLSQKIVETEALSIIEDHGQGISTSLGQWALIQGLVEEAYRRGHKDGSSR